MKVYQSKTSMVILGGSAGSLTVLLEVLEGLEVLDFPIVLVIHRRAQKESLLPQLLQQHTTKKVVELEDKLSLENNVIYVAPPDYHVLFEDRNQVALDVSAKVNFSRPSIDVIFKSAAEIYGENLLVVLLSGANSDGAEGVQHVKKSGGKVWIQDPLTAEMDYMPLQALTRVKADLLFTPNNLALHLNQLIK